MITLTDEQQAVVDLAISAVRVNRLFKIGGYAGTGKTTVAKYIAEHIPGCMPCSFTGKAAYRLKQKGMNDARTIHSTIYHYDHTSESFLLKSHNELDGGWFLIDESSMISEDLWYDLNSFGYPILLLGDPGQLEPVGADPRLMHECDVVLQQIHRQVEGNDIIRFATSIRLDKPGWSLLFGRDGGDVKAYRGPKANVADLKWADIVICALNNTRFRINETYRKIHGYKGLINAGEKIIVLRNNSEFGVYNGQILTVIEAEEPKKDTVRCLCEDDDGKEHTLPLFVEQFNQKTLNIHYDDMVLADYGYCITCHKSQGSEWEKVLVIDEQMPRLWDPARWRYTAITRASKELRYYF